MSDPLDLTGRTAIVTGGTKGLGRVIATTLLEHGAEVIVCARNAPDTPVTANGREAHFVAADVRDAEQVTAVVDVAIERASTPIERAFGRGSFSPSISRGRARETRDARARRDARVPTRSRTDPTRGGALLFDESCLVNVSPATRE